MNRAKGQCCLVLLIAPIVSGWETTGRQCECTTAAARAEGRRADVTTLNADLRSLAVSFHAAR